MSGTLTPALGYSRGVVGLLNDGGSALLRPDESKSMRARAARLRDAQFYVLLGLLCLTFGAAALSITQHEAGPVTTFTIPLLLGSLLLALRPFLALIIVQALCLAAVSG